MADLPFAVLPLWQVEQVPGATLLWLNLAPPKPLVLWQASHEALVCTWLDGFFLAVPLTWQVLQVPGTTPLWLNLAPAKVLVL
ncbi:MAG: hypothetical protein ACOY4U_07075, partial [Pseudomonadota bacterium]